MQATAETSTESMQTERAQASEDMSAMMDSTADSVVVAASGVESSLNNSLLASAFQKLVGCVPLMSTHHTCSGSNPECSAVCQDPHAAPNTPHPLDLCCVSLKLSRQWIQVQWMLCRLNAGKLGMVGVIVCVATQRQVFDLSRLLQ